MTIDLYKHIVAWQYRFIGQFRHLFIQKIMEINGPPPPLVTPRLLQASVNTWQVGQVLQAVVVKQAAPQSVILQVNNQQLQADTNVSLTAGQRLELTVAQTGDKPVLQARLLTPTATSTPPATTTPDSKSQAQNAAAKVTKSSTMLNSSSTQGTRSSDNISPQSSLPPTRSAPSAPQAAPATTESTINNLMKQALPKQASMTSLLANIAWLNNQTSQTTPLPKSILDIVKQLYKEIPAKENLTESKQVKQSINNSGIFLENKLQKTATDKTGGNLNQVIKESLLAKPDKAGASPANTGLEKIGTDLKASLLRLLGTINQVARTTPKQSSHTAAILPSTNTPALPFTLPTMRGNAPQAQPKVETNLQTVQGNFPLLLLELGKQTEAALARTQLHQAASLPAGEQTNINLAFELPIRNNEQLDLFDVLIEEEKPNEQDEEDNKHPWSITLAFDLEGLGPVHAKLKLVENKISTLFWAERAETSQLFNQHLSDLVQRFQQSGLEADELHCFQGTPPGAAGNTMPHIVLDVKA